MELDPELKKALDIFKQCKVDANFWGDERAFNQKIPNNIIFRKMREFYIFFEEDPEMKEYFTPVLDFLIFMYVVHPKWRMRIGWMFWWVILYVQDKQFTDEVGDKMQLETWNDPRVWKDWILKGQQPPP